MCNDSPRQLHNPTIVLITQGIGRAVFFLFMPHLAVHLPPLRAVAAAATARAAFATRPHAGTKMGIKGLHKFLQIAQRVTLSEFAGMRVAVDASAWLHRGLSSCAMEIEEGQASDRFLTVMLRLLDALARYDVTPFVVFDGAALPQKEERAREEGGRSNERSAFRAQAIEALQRGDRAEATKLCAKAASVAPWMAAKLIDVLRSRGLPFVVAPYEADPQLAFLVREGHCAAAISEDSDLLPYGCPRTLFKLSLDTDEPEAQMVLYSDLQSAEDGKGRVCSGARQPTPAPPSPTAPLPASTSRPLS
jgi:hypothetical protein